LFHIKPPKKDKEEYSRRKVKKRREWEKGVGKKGT